MRCKDAKHYIKVLQHQLRVRDARMTEMRDEIDRLTHEVNGEHFYRFDQLEIIVRPHGTHTVFRPVFEDTLRVDLTVWGNDQCPTIHNYRVVALGALDLTLGSRRAKREVPTLKDGDESEALCQKSQRTTNYIS